MRNYQFQIISQIFHFIADGALKRVRLKLTQSILSVLSVFVYCVGTFPVVGARPFNFARYLNPDPDTDRQRVCSWRRYDCFVNENRIAVYITILALIFSLLRTRSIAHASSIARSHILSILLLLKHTKLQMKFIWWQLFGYHPPISVCDQPQAIETRCAPGKNFEYACCLVCTIVRASAFKCFYRKFSK